MKVWICAFVFILAIGIGECDTNHQSIFLMTNESIIGIDLNDPSTPMFRHEISRNPHVDRYDYLPYKTACSSSKELRISEANSIISFDLSDTDNIKQEVMFNSSTYPDITSYTHDFDVEILRGRNVITGMTVDPMTSTTYFATSNLISAMNSKKEWRTLIEFDETGLTVYHVEFVCLISSENRLYWLSNGTNLYSAFTDGSDLKKLKVNLHYSDFKQMVADQNKKALYLVSKSNRIVVVNTKTLKTMVHEKAVQSIAVDHKNGDVFITELNEIENGMVLKKFDPFSDVGESSFSIILPYSSDNSIVVHRRDENWLECKDCDGICLRKRDNTTLCECPQNLIRDQKSGKCITPEKRFFFLQFDNRIVSMAWPNETNEHSINVAGNAIEFQHFAVDYTRDLIYAVTFENSLWKFSTNGTFIRRTYENSHWRIVDMDVDTVTGNLVVMIENTKTSYVNDNCHIALYGPNLEKIYLFHQKWCGQHLQVDETVDKIFYSTRDDVRSANMNGKNIKVVLSGMLIDFSLDKKKRTIVYQTKGSDIFECVDYDGEKQECSVELSFEKLDRFRINNDDLYAVDEEKHVCRAARHHEGFIEVERTSIPILARQTHIDIMEVSQLKPSTKCSHKNGGCEGFCVIADGKKQCLCKENHWRLDGECARHTQFLAFLDTKFISFFNPDGNVYNPLSSTIRPFCYRKTPVITVSLTLNNKKNVIYYSEIGGIFSMNSEGKDCDTVFKIDGNATGLTIDEVNQDLYFINDNKHQIMKVNLLKKNRILTLVYESKNKKDVFAHLQYEQCSKSLYFSNNNQNGASIEAIKIKGRTHRQIVQNLDAVYGMAIDREARKIYYSHSERKQVTRCDYDGEFSENLMNEKNLWGASNLWQYGDLAIINNNLIFLHSGTEFVAINKNNMEDRRTILKTKRGLTFLSTIDRDQDKCPDDPCTTDDVGCSGSCRQTASGDPACVCLRPKILEKDGKTCSIPVEKYIKCDDNILKCSDYCKDDVKTGNATCGCFSSKVLEADNETCSYRNEQSNDTLKNNEYIVYTTAAIVFVIMIIVIVSCMWKNSPCVRQFFSRVRQFFLRTEQHVPPRDQQEAQQAEEVAERLPMSTRHSPRSASSRSLQQVSPRAALQGSSESLLQGSSRSPLQVSSESPQQGSSRAPLQGSSESLLQGSSRSPLQGSSRSPLQGSSESPQQGSSRSPLQGSPQSPRQESPQSPRQSRYSLRPRN